MINIPTSHHNDTLALQVQNAIHKLTVVHPFAAWHLHDCWNTLHAMYHWESSNQASLSVPLSSKPLLSRKLINNHNLQMAPHHPMSRADAACTTCKHPHRHGPWSTVCQSCHVIPYTLCHSVTHMSHLHAAPTSMKTYSLTYCWPLESLTRHTSHPHKEGHIAALT